MDILYGFYYNGMIEENSSALMSLHRTKEGAVKSMRSHKLERIRKWRKMYSFEEEPFEFGYFEYWEVHTVEVLE